MPGIQVIPGDGSATIYWPDFGTEDAYVVQIQKANGTWRTVSTDVEAVETTDLEGPTIVDNQATIEDLKNGKEYTARIVSADSEAQAEAAVEDAIDVDGPRGSMASGRVVARNGGSTAPTTASQDVTIVPLANGENPDLIPKCGIGISLVLDVSGSIGSQIGNLRIAANAFLD